MARIHALSLTGEKALSFAHTSNAASALQTLFRLHSRKRTLKRRELIIPYYDSTKCLYQVDKGSLRVSLNNAKGDDVTYLCHLKPGDIFGEQGLFAGCQMQLATATFQARDKVDLLCVPHVDVKHAAQTEPDVYAELSTHINNRLGVTTAKLTQMLFSNLEQRCYASLIELSGLPDAMTHPDGMQILLTRIELAQMIRCSRETAGRVLKVLIEKGLIEASGQRIVLIGVRHGAPIKGSVAERHICV